jgi:hypothetical protein
MTRTDLIEAAIVSVTLVAAVTFTVLVTPVIA